MPEPCNIALTGIPEHNRESITGGDRRIFIQVTNLAGIVADPDALEVKIRTGDGTVISYVYGTDAELVRDSEGDFHVDLALATAGTWRVRAETTGELEGAVEESFYVRQSEF